MILQKNPFAVVGTIDQCLLFTFQSPPEWAEALLPDCLTPIVHNGCAFWNVVVCHVRDMRPRGFPRMLGVSYRHVAYRLYVRYQPEDAPAIEGLYFVRSDCDNRMMSTMGNLMTDFRFHAADVRVQNVRDHQEISVDVPGGTARAVVGRQAPSGVPDYSAFSTPDEAAAFLKYKPYGISVDRKGRVNVVHITRDESAWKSRLVTVPKQEWQFFNDLPARPEICYEVEPIDYQWDRGVVYGAERRTQRMAIARPH